MFNVRLRLLRRLLEIGCVLLLLLLLFLRLLLVQLASVLVQFNSIVVQLYAPRLLVVSATGPI